MTTQSKITPASADRQRLGLFRKIKQLSVRSVLILIIILAVFLRLISAVIQGNIVNDLPGIFDQISYHGLAQRIVGGYGFSHAEDHWPSTRGGEPTAHWSYLYTLYLATLYKLFGVYPLLARMIQAIIAGIFQILFTWRIGRRVFGTTVGLLASVLSAVYVYFFYYAGALITESFYIVGILWTFDVAFRLVSAAQASAGNRSWRIWLELGLAIGLTVLLRQIFLLFLPFLFLWIWWNTREFQGDGAKGKNSWKHTIHWSAIKGLALVALVVALLIAPWTIRNYHAFGTFVLLNTNAGFAFFWGNHPIHGTHFIPLLPGGEQQYYDLIPTDLMHLNEAEMDKALLKTGLQFVWDDPIRFLILSISRMEEYFKFWPSGNSSLISNISRVASFGLFLPFILYGLFLSLTETWKSRIAIEKWAIGLLITFVLIYTAIHLFSWTLIRYRLPVDAVLLIFAGIAVDKLGKKFGFFR